MTLRAAIVVLPLLLASCDMGASPSARMRAVATLSASPTGGRSAATASLITLLAERKITVENAINAAEEAIIAATPGADPAAVAQSASATEFAGAVLDAIAARQDKMATGGEFELFWARVGGLAFKAAEEAHARGRVAEALSLVFAGGSRWNHDAYWSRRPDHDALAAVILAKNNRRSEAIARLQSRAELGPPADEVLRMLQRGQ